MTSSRKRRKTSTTSEVESEEATQEVSTQVQPQPQVSTIPTALTPEEEELRNLLTELLAKAQELAFELATTEDEVVLRSPLASKARELVVIIKKLFIKMRLLGRGRGTSQPTM